MLAALGSLTMQKRFLENVLPKDQGFQSDYAGIFHFRVCILCCIGTAGVWLVGLHRGQNCSPRSRHLRMLWFFSAESQFRIFQKTPSFLTSCSRWYYQTSGDLKPFSENFDLYPTPELQLPGVWTDLCTYVFWKTFWSLLWFQLFIVTVNAPVVFIYFDIFYFPIYFSLPF